jgi:dipeptidyl aminopeptidase/acylaminoacyl peptidase
MLMRRLALVLAPFIVLASGCGKESASSSSPRNGKIAFVRGTGTAEIHVINTDGSGDRLLSHAVSVPQGTVSWSPTSPRQLSWAPGGGSLAFATPFRSVNVPFTSDFGWAVLAEVKLDQSTRLFPPFSRHASTEVIRRAGLASDLAARNGEGAWSPDGDLAFVAVRGDGSGISLLAADGSRTRRLTWHSRDASSFDLYPAWSPDGRRIAFVRGFLEGSKGVRFEIFVLNRDGSHQTQMTRGGDNGEPAWSPDGRFIAYSSARGAKPSALQPAPPSIWVMNADGSQRRRLTKGLCATYPAWSPDGSKIVFSRYRQGTNGIAVMNADGSHVHWIDFHQLNNDYAPVWQPLSD